MIDSQRIYVRAGSRTPAGTGRVTHMWAAAWREVVWNVGARGQVEVTCPGYRRSVRTSKRFCWSNKRPLIQCKGPWFTFSGEVSVCPVKLDKPDNEEGDVREPAWRPGKGRRKTQRSSPRCCRSGASRAHPGDRRGR